MVIALSASVQIERKRELQGAMAAAALMTDLLSALQNQPAAERTRAIDAMLFRIVKEVSGLSVTMEMPLMDGGLDSLAATELGNNLQRELGANFKVSSTLMFDYPTVNMISQHVNEQIENSLETTKSMNEQSNGTAASEITKSTNGSLTAGITAHTPTAAAIQSDLCQQNPSLTVCVKQRNTESIVLVGMHCSLPGTERGVTDYGFTWQTVFSGYDSVQDADTQRFRVDPEHLAANNLKCVRGHFLPGLELFEHHLFVMSAAEVHSTDPSHRLILQSSFAANVSGGQSRASMSGSSTGVFLGLCNTADWPAVQRDKTTSTSEFSTTGSDASAAAGRVSYLFGLKGPCFTVNTACSSSAVAMDAGCANLQLGKCARALVVGVCLQLHASSWVALIGMHLLSPDGYCKTFDTAADGFGRSEACGAVVLQHSSVQMQVQCAVPLEGTAVNHDGRSASFMAPNGPSQISVVQAALLEAAVSEAHVEVHGTGTALGDTIEITALSRVFGRHDRLVPIGFAAFKTHMAHSEGASGMVAVIKTALEVRQRGIAPTLHLKKLNSRMELDTDTACVLASQAQLVSRARATAGASSFGYTGTNAHCVLSAGSLSVMNSFQQMHYQHTAFVWWEGRGDVETELNPDDCINSAQANQRHQFLEDLLYHKTTSMTCTIQALLVVVVRQKISRTLGLEDPLMQMGVTSRIAVTLTHEIQKNLGGAVKVNAVTLMNHPTVLSLAKHIVEQLEAVQGTTEDILLGVASFIDTADTEWRQREDVAMGSAPANSGSVTKTVVPSLAVKAKLASAYNKVEQQSPRLAMVAADRQPPRVTVTALACSLPGTVTNLVQLWDVLRDSKVLITNLVPEKWQQKCLNIGVPSPALVGAFIDLASNSDAGKASAHLSERELKLHSEEHIGLLMHVLRDALESIPDGPNTRNQSIGVFTAADATNFEQPVAAFMLARMVAWMLQVDGPATNIDAACSSGYLAIKHALDSIHTQECPKAAVSAVSLIRNPQHAQNLLLSGMMSISGKAYPLDDSADGMIAGEY